MAFVEAAKETDLRRLIAPLALIAAVATALVIVGVGLALLLISDSGERGSGALLILGGSLALAVVLVLLRAKDGTFAGRAPSAAAIAAGLIAAAPVAGIAIAALRFTGLPFQSPAPMIDWPVFFVGIAFAIGALAIVALGYRRSLDAEPPPVVHMQQIRSAQEQLRAAFESGLAAPSTPQPGEVGEPDDDEISVRRV